MGQEFDEIYKENAKVVMKFLLSMTRDYHLAEELTQETFFRAYMNLSGLREEEKVTSWLCQIAKNTYFAWFRAQKKHQPLDETLVTDSTPDIADLFAEKELAGRAFSVLHALEEPYKEVFMLSVFGGLSLKVISAMFGKSESWARVTYYRAKQKIMEGLGR